MKVDLTNSEKKKVSAACALSNTSFHELARDLFRQSLWLIVSIGPDPSRAGENFVSLSPPPKISTCARSTSPRDVRRFPCRHGSACRAAANEGGSDQLREKLDAGDPESPK